MITIDLRYSDKDLERMDESWRKKFNHVEFSRSLCAQREEYLIKNALQKHLGRKPEAVDNYFTQRVYLEDSNDYQLFYCGIELGKMVTKGRGRDQVFDFLELKK
ncbi:hypothetical protein [Leeuwenhoekiella sp. CH_XMU1409-2]|uniref:hypothetical protein n=1 Tax=Leeuwenhoekiella sp. CH_XMU1409-2 TaxID=3107768 RepID=UPI0030098CAD